MLWRRAFWHRTSNQSRTQRPGRFVFCPPLMSVRPRVRLSARAEYHPSTRGPSSTGDFWPGNILWRHRELAAVIDWEDACIGDPLADLATARVELLCRYGASAMDRFTRCYLAQSTLELRLDPLPVWEVYVSASALSTMHQWGLDAVEEAARRRSTQSFFDHAVRQISGR